MSGKIHPVSQTLRQQGRTQRWLARQIQIDETTLSRYLHGRRTMPLSVMQRIATVLGVPESFYNSAARNLPNGTFSIQTEATESDRDAI